MLVSEKLRSFGTTVFAEMTRLAQENAAINLSQGFPDFEGPPEIREAATRAMAAGHNQYARSQGVPELVRAVAAHQKKFYDLDFDPLTEVGVFSGATEGLMSSMLGLLNPGDEVVMFEPHYDSYRACAAMAQATPRFVTLSFPDYALDVEALERAINGKTRVLLLNTPHNPTGKVFTREELGAIAEVVRKHDLLVVSDEVYEHLTYDDAQHVPIATLPGMRDRTLTVSSFGKTYSFTGWKIGWASGPADMLRAAQAAHQFVVFSTATPLQHAAAFALTELGASYYRELRADYSRRRERLLSVLREVGLETPAPQGAYFALARFAPRFDGTDVEFARHLATEVRVAAVPPSAFYSSGSEEGRHLVRFAFCKQLETLDAAATRLRAAFATTP